MWSCSCNEGGLGGKIQLLVSVAAAMDEGGLPTATLPILQIECTSVIREVVCKEVGLLMERSDVTSELLSNYYTLVHIHLLELPLLIQIFSISNFLFNCFSNFFTRSSSHLQRQ